MSQPCIPDEKKYIGKTVIVGGANGTIRMELIRSLLNDGVTNLGLLDSNYSNANCLILKKEFPAAKILYESADLLNRASTIEHVKKMKKAFKSPIEYFIIDAHPLSDDKIEQIKDPKFFMAVNLSLVGIALMDAKTEKYAGGVITVLIPLDNVLPNSSIFPSYNAKKHALTGYMIALSEEYKDQEQSKLTFLAIAYKTNRFADEVQKLKDMSVGTSSTPKRAAASTADKTMPDIPEVSEVPEVSEQKPSTSAAAWKAFELEQAASKSGVSPRKAPTITPEITLSPPPPDDVNMEDISDLPKTLLKRGHTSPTPSEKSKPEYKSDVQLITSIIGSVNKEHVLWTVHNGEKKSLHFAKYCP